MRRLLLAALTLPVLALGAPAAQATPDYHYVGGCWLATAWDGEVAYPPRWSGVGGVLAAATTERLGTPAPTANVDVTCDLYLNGSYLTSLRGVSGSGVVADVQDLTVYRYESDVLTLCENVDVEGDRHLSCTDVSNTSLVPDPVEEALDVVGEELDPLLCLALGAGAPGVRGIVDIEPDGTTYVLGGLVYDCSSGQPSGQRRDVYVALAGP